MGGLLHLVHREGDWAGPQPAQAPTRRRPMYQSLLLCGFSVLIKGLIIMNNQNLDGFRLESSMPVRTLYF